MVVLVLLAAEAVVRAQWRHFSADLTNLSTFDDQAQCLCGEGGGTHGPDSHAAFRVVAVGNSLTANGIKLDAFRDEVLSSRRAPLTLQPFALHGSSITEWYQVFDRFFVQPGKLPDMLLIDMSPAPFEGRDEALVDVRVPWIAIECRLQDAPRILWQDLDTFGNRAEFLHCLAFRSFACRDMIKTDVLYGCVPNYWRGTVYVNEVQKQVRAKRSIAGPRPAACFDKLRRLVALAQSHGVVPILVLMPVRDPGDSDEGVIQVARECDIPVLKCRCIDGMTRNSFEDGWHMNPMGAEAFSRYLARELPQYLVRAKQGR
jgi:hypothetical protein